MTHDNVLKSSYPICTCSNVRDFLLSEFKVIVTISVTLLCEGCEQYYHLTVNITFALSEEPLLGSSYWTISLIDHRKT